MTRNEARAIVYRAFVDGWDDQTSYVFDNEPFNTKGIEEYVRVSMRETSSVQSCLGEEGNRKFERRGLVFVQIFVAVDRGLQRFDELAQQARDIYEGKTLVTIQLYEGTTREGSVEGEWFPGTVGVPYFFDEVK